MKYLNALSPLLVRSLLGSALLASPLLALTPSEFESLLAKADRGNSIAQYNLGLAYADRRETIYDPAQAYAWLSLAAANGTNGKALANLTSLLTPEQLAEGNRRVAALNASPVSPVSAEISPIIGATAPHPAAPASPATEPDTDQKKLSAELAAAWKENDLLKSGLTAQLTDANKRVAIAEAALASKDKEIATLQARLAETQAAPAINPPAPATIGLSAELASLRSERDQLHTTATAALAELSELRAQSAKAAASETALSEKLARATAELAEARRVQAQTEAENSSLKAASDRAGAERLAVAAQLESATTELAAAKAAVAAPAALPPQPDPRIASLENERNALAASVKTLEQERADLTAQLIAAKNTIPAALPAAPATTPTVAPESDSRLAELEKAKADADDKIAAALRSFTLQQTEIDRLQKALASIDEERAATVTKLEAATTELTTLRPQVSSAATLSAEAATLRTQLTAANQTITDQSTSLATANRSLADARQTVDAATAELVATRDQLRQTQAQSAAFAIENQQLKTKLALTGNLASANTPSRPGTVPSIQVNLPVATVAPVTPPPAPVTTPAATAPRVHTVSSGDSLSKISKQYYGTANRWNDILQANKDSIRNPDALTLGTKLRIP